MSQKVYLVSEEKHDDHFVRGVFSTKEKSEAFLGDALVKDKEEYSGYEIEEYELDDLRDQRLYRGWNAQVRRDSGQVTEFGVTYSQFKLSDPRDPIIKGDMCHEPWGLIVATSFVSQEHATQVAIEKHKEWLSYHPQQGVS